MIPHPSRKLRPIIQYCISLLGILSIAGVCFAFSPWLGYRSSALILLMSLSVFAVLFDIGPVVVCCLVSSLIWNFLFIEPLFTFHIERTEDILMFSMYFIIALLNAILTFKIRQAEKRARDKEEKEKTLALYDTLLNSLSHEMRTPLSAILGAVDTLKENREQLSPQTQQELLAQIDMAGLRLNRQVENLLNMSRIESGNLMLHADWIDMNEVVSGLVEKFRVLSAHPLEFTPNEKLPLFKSDVILVEQIISNLLHNAILYTPAEQPIRIFITATPQGCCIVIQDQGPGFPEPALPFIFDKFYRLPNSPAGGTGLGLSIVKGFAEALGGSVAVQNDPAGGARFTFTLPAETTFINHLKNE